jgi:putative ABC transport system substrate-binding protein
MKRREFIALLGGAAGVSPLLWPHAARPQSVRRVGVLMNGAATETQPQSYMAAFVQELRQLGWIEGQNLRVDVRWNAGDAALARLYAAQLIGLSPDVILCASSTNLEVLRQATSTIPIVFTQVSDPVAQGFVRSVTKPGGNLTGFYQYEFSIGGKWLDLLKEAAPDLARVVVMFNPTTSPQSKYFMRAVEAAASALHVQAAILPIGATTEIEPALKGFASEPNGGLMLPTDTFTRLRQGLIAELTTRYGLPTISSNIDFPRDGGLMYYGNSASLAETFRQAASYVDRILKGAKPGDLPIQAPTIYELIINLKIAKALGVTIPLPLSGLADELIE